jgi:hypothetical protein
MVQDDPKSMDPGMAALCCAAYQLVVPVLVLMAVTMDEAGEVARRWWSHAATAIPNLAVAVAQAILAWVAIAKRHERVESAGPLGVVVWIALMPGLWVVCFYGVVAVSLVLEFALPKGEGMTSGGAGDGPLAALAVSGVLAVLLVGPWGRRERGYGSWIRRVFRCQVVLGMVMVGSAVVAWVAWQVQVAMRDGKRVMFEGMFDSLVPLMLIATGCFGVLTGVGGWVAGRCVRGCPPP